MSIFGILLGFLPIVLLIALVVAVSRRDEEQTSTEAAGLVRRLFLYGLTFAALVVAAQGLTWLLEAVLARPTLAREGAGDVAGGLAFTVVGLPLYYLLWRAAVRRVRGDREERRSLGWGLYVAGASVVALVVAAASVVETIGWITGGSAAPDAAARALVWGGVWAAHWWMLRHPQLAPQRFGEAALLVGSLVGLVMLAVGAGVSLTVLADAAYARLVDRQLVEGGLGEHLRGPLAAAVVGGGIWAWYWLRTASRLPRRGAVLAYLLVAGVFAGLVTLLASAGTVLFLLLEWALGDPESTSLAAQLSPLPAALVTALVGGLVWSYHRQQVSAVGGVGDTTAGRSYRYLLAGTGLVAAVTGLGMVVNGLLKGVAEPLVSTDPATDTILAGVTSMVMGVPVWLSGWRRAQAALAGDPAEATTTPRRVYLGILAGLAGVVALVSLLVVAFELFEGVLEGRRLAAVVESIRVALGLLVATGAAAAYHLGVWRRDRDLAPAPTTRVAQVLVVGDGVASGVAERLRRSLEVPVSLRTVSESADSTLDGLEEALRELHTRRAVVVVEGERVRVMGTD